MSITEREAVAAIKAIGRNATAKEIGEWFGTDSRAVATAMRGPTSDGRVTIYYGKGSKPATYRYRSDEPAGREDGFSDGILYALAVLTLTGDAGSAQYEAIIHGAGEEKVVARARKEGAMKWAGVDQHLRMNR